MCCPTQIKHILQNFVLLAVIYWYRLGGEWTKRGNNNDNNNYNNNNDDDDDDDNYDNNDGVILR